MTYSRSAAIDALLASLLDLARAGSGALALRRLDELQTHSDVTPEAILQHRTSILQLMSCTLQKYSHPIDLDMVQAAGGRGAALPRFRRFPKLDLPLPRPYPYGFVLPKAGALVSAALSPPEEAALRLPAGLPAGLGAVLIVLCSDHPQADLEALLAQLRSQSLQVDAKIAVFSPNLPAAGHMGAALYVPYAIQSPQAQPILQQIARSADQILFLEGGTTLDPMAMERLCRAAACSNRLVQPLVAPKADSAFQPFSRTNVMLAFPTRLPFRGVAGFNMMLSAQLWAEVGGIAPRFSARAVAAVEMGYRLFIAGAWFAPQQVPQIGNKPAPAPSAADIALYKSLCPNRVDRPDGSGAGFEVPKVSIYIPAYNAAQFLPDAIDSVLAQDYADLEICIHDDGSTDTTVQMLQDRYGSNARVRWQSGPNRGIGHASNAAIAMGRGLYIGQLDADDRLLPGAVARLVAQLEQNPDLACAYASCQRIDAAGNVIKPEYDWPVFSPEKLALTSIVHHFRMFRRQAFARTDGFRCDLRNAVDYDIFLKLAEVGQIQHVPEILYQRRWHGGNTSQRFEAEQSRNTHVVQRAALVRRGLQAHWDIAVPNPQAPRDVTYQRKPDSQMLLFWPDYSAENPYQPLLYEHLTASGVEVCAASPAAALRAIRAGTLKPARLTFHLHWLNFVFRDITALPEAQAAARKLLEVILCLKTLGVRLVWTVHNLVSHDSAFAGVEIALQSQLTRIVDVVHLHDKGALGAVRGQIAIAPEKLHIARHGNYIGTYPDYVPRATARQMLGLSDTDEVILFCGAVRPYKGVPELITAFDSVLARRPKARLVIAGAFSFDPFADLRTPLSPATRARILQRDSFVEHGEMQLYFNAADVAALPYRQILTSGSLLLALGFGCPVVLPAQSVPATGLQTMPFVQTYAAQGGPDALAGAVEAVLALGPVQRGSICKAARDYALGQTWQGKTHLPLMRPI